MHATTELVVGPGPTSGSGPVSGPGPMSPPGYRVERMVGQAPVAWRATPEGVYLVGSAASPVGDDRVVVSVRVRAGARLAIRSTAATIAWAGNGSRHDLSVDVEEGAHLDWEPEPMVATARCDHVQRAAVRLAPLASLRWREVLVAGRTQERAGRLRSSVAVDRGGRPLLRHATATGPGSAWSSPAVMGANRVSGLLLLVPPPAGQPERPELPERPEDDGWAAMPLHAGGVLIVAVGPDVPTVAARLAAAEHRGSSQR